MNRLICIGDSHVEVFNRLQFNDGSKPIVCVVEGATNMGLKNPNSSTNAKVEFEKFLDINLTKDDTLLTMLGEIDCGFVVWWRSEVKGDTIESQFNESLNNYKDFVNKYTDKCKQIVMCDAPPPVLPDNDTILTNGMTLGEVGRIRQSWNNRYNIVATLKDRVELTQRYNNEIKSFCKENGYTYIPWMADTLGKNQHVLESFRHKDWPVNHHLDEMAFVKLIANKLTILNI
jgi:hypothetical protein